MKNPFSSGAFRFNRVSTFALILVALVLGIGTSSLSGYFLWDDQFWILENRFMESWRFLPQLLSRSVTEGANGVVSNFYRPLQLFTHFLDVRLFGMNAWWHHVSNVLLQGLLAVLVFQLFRRLLPRRDQSFDFRIEAAFFAATLWILHPLQSQAVGYLSGRGDLLVASFMVGAALSWSRSRLASSLLCLGAMLSKESGIMAPLFVALLAWAESRQDAERFRPLSLWPLAIPAAIYGISRLTWLNFQNTLNFYNASNVLTEHYSYRVFTYLTTLAKGLQLVFWPYDIHHERSWLVYADWKNWLVLTGAGLLTGLLALAYFLRRRAPLATAGILWFLLAGLPTSNLIALINAPIYDHWFLLPALGFAIAVLPFFRGMLERYSFFPVAGLWVVTLAPLAVTTWFQHATWRTPAAQYEHILRFEPNSSKIQNNLAMEYFDQRRWPEAEQLYKKSIELQETPQARNNLGNLYLEADHLPEAEKELTRALEMDPNLFQAARNLGRLKILQGDCKGAAERFEQALKVFPDPLSQNGLNYAQNDCPKAKR